MNLIDKMIQFYFNFAYNPFYDLIVGQLHHYRELQSKCINKLDLRDNDWILCVGLGTGNEVNHILQKNKNVNIVGVDFSKNALKRAHKKALSYGKEIDVLSMDIKRLEFANGSFDNVLCLHVMDFVNDCVKVTNEILRVLKNGGQFVITFPSEKEGVKLGFNLLNDSIRHNDDSEKSRLKAIYVLLARMLLGCVYLPLLMRPRQKAYSRSELEAMISKLTTGNFQIEEDSIYQDFIVYGENY